MRKAVLKTILVIDDQRAVADSIAMVLKLYGHEVRVAYDAEQAIVSAAERRPDMVMLDLSLPVLDGYELARHLRALHGPSIYLVAHTGWDDEETKRRVSAAGFNAHLRKPATMPELIAAIG